MKRLLLLLGLAFLPLSAHAAPQSVQWGYNTGNPWTVCLFDSADICQQVFTMTPTGGTVLFSPAVGGTGINNGSNTLTLNSSAIVGTTAGTLASSATSPLVLNSTTGVISCSTCTGALSATPPLNISGSTFSITGVAGEILAGSGPAFTPTPTLGVAGSTVGTLAFANATSGSITLTSPTGALSSSVLTLPAATDQLVGRSTIDTLTNKTLTSPTINSATLASPTVTTAFIATGLVTNGDLVFPSMTVNGTTCTLGSTCSPAASVATLTVGSTTITSGTTGEIEYNNSGTLGEKAVTGTGSVVLATSPTISAPTISSNPVFSNPLSGANGGTGVVNTSKTITLGANLTTTGGATTLGLGATGRTYTFPDAAGTVDLIAQSQTLTNKTIASGSNNITGEVGGSSPSAGNIGEVIDSTVTSGSPVSLSTATPKNITSISLTAGNWLVYGTILFTPAGSTTVAGLVAGISATTGTLPTSGLTGETFIQTAFTTGGYVQQLATGSTYVSINSPATYYLVAEAVFAVSTMTAIGEITAIRQP